jgi:hypothetical protein
MTDESKKAAEQLAAEIFGRTMSAWNVVYTFRWIGRLGLPHAANQAHLHHKRASHQFATADEYKNMFIGDTREKLAAQDFLIPVHEK